MKRAAAALVLCLPAWLPALNAASPELEIRIVYDNTAARSGVRADWGFAAVIDFGGHRMLFDSGMKADVLTGNLAALGIDPASFERVVISHAHGDHANGVAGITAKKPDLMVFHPGTDGDPFIVLPGIHSTGMVKGMPPEQAVVIETSKGLVVVTGCSHPGVVRMIEAAEAQRAKKAVYLLVGGFHMLDQKPDAIAATVARLRELQVQSIVPTHCTGALAIRQFREAYGAQFREGGAGQRIAIE